MFWLTGEYCKDRILSTEAIKIYFHGYASVCIRIGECNCVLVIKIYPPAPNLSTPVHHPNPLPQTPLRR